MQGEKDIFRQFRDQQDVWDEQAAPELWDRLESRLDAGPEGPQGSTARPFIIVVVALFIFLGAGLWISSYLGDDSTSLTIKQNPQETEQNVPVPAYAQGNKTVNANKEILKEAPETAFNSLQVQPSLQENGPVKNANFPKPEHQKLNPRPVNLPNSTEADWNEILSVPMTGNGAAYAYNTASIDPGNMVVTNNFGNPIDTVGSVSNFINSSYRGNYQAFDNSYLQLNVGRNEISFLGNPSVDSHNPATLGHFNWLLGSWKTNGPSGATFEEWKQVDEFTIEGRGFFVINGDTMFTERMRIEQKGEDVYYIVAVDSTQHPLKFRLRSRKPNEAIFENPSGDFPNEVIYRNSSDNSNYSTILQNGEMNPGNSLQQKNFLRSRNASLNNGQVIRNMSRNIAPAPPPDVPLKAPNP